MILRRIAITNFGIYKGENEFVLNPQHDSKFNRPVVLFRGKNGVGKTTLVDAIRLGLHGSLILGNRVGQREFEEYLVQSIHHSGNGKQAKDASVELDFEYVHAGKKHLYQIGRRWIANGKRAEHTLAIREDDCEVDLPDNENGERFLRELVPPGLLDLFFFDGERIETLSRDNPDSNLLLAATVKTLLGLDIVNRLSKDLDIYLARRSAIDDDTNELRIELASLIEEEEELDRQYRTVQHERHTSETQIAQLKMLIDAQQQRISNEGGQFAELRDQQLEMRGKLESSVELQRKYVQDLCSELMPFAISPKMLESVAKRLLLEKVIENTHIVSKALIRGLDNLATSMTSDDFWEGIDKVPDAESQNALVARISSQLRNQMLTERPEEQESIHIVSEQERMILLGWIDQAMDAVPKQFSSAVQGFTEYQRLLSDVNDDLDMVPAEETLAPLIQSLNDYHRELGHLEKAQDALHAEEERLAFHLERVSNRKQKVRDHFEENRADDRRTQLAVRTQRALASYDSLLTEKKVAKLEKLLVRRFNTLCRKVDFLDSVVIDRNTFEITPYRLGKMYGRQQLSAGEQQLFAIATLWALREVSERPIPIVIDTPLSRLDSEHRQSMVQEFIPHSAHQVIVLGTDSEIDDSIYDRLLPAISHVYDMRFDPLIGATRYFHEIPMNGSAA